MLARSTPSATTSSQAPSEGAPVSEPPIVAVFGSVGASVSAATLWKGVGASVSALTLWKGVGGAVGGTVGGTVGGVVGGTVGGVVGGGVSCSPAASPTQTWLTRSSPPFTFEFA